MKGPRLTTSRRWAFGWTAPALATLLFALLAIGGVWELFRGGAHRPHLGWYLVVLWSALLLSFGEYIPRREVIAEAQSFEDRFRSVLLAGHSLVWDFDLETRQASWFGDLKTMFGTTEEQMPQTIETFYGYVHPDDRQRVSDAVDRARRDRSPYAIEFHVIDKDDTIRCMSATGEFRYSKHGAAVRMVGLAVDITLHENAEEALRRKHDLEEAQRLAHVGSWEWDSESGVISWSEELYRIYGLDPSQPAPGFEELPKLYTPETWNRLQQAMESKSFPDLDMELIRPDGTRRWIQTRFEVTRDSSGVIIKCRGVSRDITEEKHTRDQLRENESRINAIFESATDAIITVDDQQRIVLFNAAAENMFQCPAHLALGVPLERLIPPAHHSLHLLPSSKSGITSRAIAHMGKLYGLRPNGEVFPMEASISRADSSGQSFFTLIIRDVTERLRADEALRKSEEGFRQIANTAPMMIWMCGPDGSCNYLNNPWLDFTGCSLESELGEGWTEGIHPDDVHACLQQTNQGFAKRATVVAQYRLRRHDGEYRWILDKGVPRFNPDGTYSGYIGSCIDITDRKQAEEAMTNIGRRLLEAHEEERAWIGRELHDDINQRLALLAVELEQESRKSSRTKDQQTLSRVRQRIVEIAQDVQALSHRLHSSKLEYLGLAKAAKSLCKEVSEQSHVEVSFTQTNVPRILSKEVSLCLFRVLQEALQNAVKHSGAKQFTVNLYGASDSIELQVTDTGVGFEQSNPFSRPGIGLISMHERLQMVDGELSIKSEPGAGTTVYARVPLIHIELKSMVG